MGYKHLIYLQRCQILAFWKAGYTQRSIAKEIGVHESTISRELKRNITFVRTRLGSWQYKPDYAQSNANQRHKNKNKFIKFTDYAKSFVREKLQQNWSPDQISGYAKKHNLFIISGEWISQFILQDKNKRENYIFIYVTRIKNTVNAMAVQSDKDPLKTGVLLMIDLLSLKKKSESGIGKLIPSLANNGSKQW